MRNRDRGFTLIELLLGLSIFSIIILSIYGTFWSGVRLSHQSQQKSKIYREIRWSMELLEKELENMVPYDFSQSYPELTAFEGKKTTISFLLPTGSGLKSVRYYLLSPEDEKVHQIIIGSVQEKNTEVVFKTEEQLRTVYLVREEKDFLDFLSEGEKEGGIEILSTTVKEDGLQFSFGYSEGDDTSVTWKKDWASNEIPSNVRIELEFLNNDKNQNSIFITKDILIPSGFQGSEEEDESS